MSTSSPTDISVKLGSDSFVIYECELFDLKVKCADVEGVNMYQVSSFANSYNTANKKPIVEFKKFLQYEDTPAYIEELYRIDQVLNSDLNFFDNNKRWNIPNVIVYCYSQTDNTRGYWVCGDLLMRYAQAGCIHFSVVVNKLVYAIATQNIDNIKRSKELLTLRTDQYEKRSAELKKETNRYTNYLQPDVGKNYVAYVEWNELKNEIFLGSLEKNKFMKERGKHDEDGKPVRYFVYATDNKFGIQLRDIFKDTLVDTFRGYINVRNNHLIFKEKTTLKSIECIIRNRLQKVRRDFTIIEI